MENEYIKIILDFVEGRMTAEEFWEEFKSKEIIRDLMVKQEIKDNRSPDLWCSARYLLTSIKDIKKYYYSDMLHTSATIFFENSDIPVKVNTFYNDRYRFLIKIQPDWLDIDYSNEKFLIDLVASAPKDLKETQKLKWCQDKLKELFRYDSRPPRWIQHAEWPIKNGKPLIFKEQSKERKESELVKFFFYDPETGEEVIIRQYF